MTERLSSSSSESVSNPSPPPGGDSRPRTGSRPSDATVKRRTAFIRLCSSEWSAALRICWVKAWLMLQKRNPYAITTIVQACSFLILVALFWATMFIGVRRLCHAMIAYPVVGAIMISRIFSLIFLAVFLLSFSTHIFTAFGSLFIKPDLRILHVTPVSPRMLFRVQAIEALIRGTWMIGLICVPLLFAFGSAMQAPTRFYIVALLGLLPFLLIGGALGVILTLCVVRFFVGKPIRLQVLSMFLVMLVTMLIWEFTPRITQFFSSPSAETLSKHLATLGNPTESYLAYSWMWELLNAGSKGATADVWLYVALLITTMWILFVLMAWLGDRFYLTGWLAMQDHSGRRRSVRRIRFRFIPLVLRPFPRWFAALVRRDEKLFLRDASQWSQLIMVLGLVLFYMIHVYNFSLGPTNPDSKTYIALFNIVLLGFVQATLALRYAFPSISMEGPAVWVVLKSPLGVERYLLSKLLSQLVWILMFGIGMTWLLNYLLEIQPPVSHLGFMVAALFSICFTACTVGLGAYFANFKTGNVTDISSSTGALVTIIATLSYLAFSVAILTRLVLIGTFKNQQLPAVAAEYNAGAVMYIVLFVVLQSVAVVYPLFLGAKSLREV